MTMKTGGRQGHSEGSEESKTPSGELTLAPNKGFRFFTPLRCAQNDIVGPLRSE